MRTLHEIFAAQKRNKQGQVQQTLERHPFVSFSYGGGRYAVSIQHVREVVEMQTINPYPVAPPEHCGIVNIRGRILPVVHPNLRGQQHCSSSDRLIIMEFEENQPFCLCVSQVSKVLLDPMEAEAGYTVNVNDQPILILDQSMIQLGSQEAP
jgi:purine-binding chemotaxis protein CheW